MIFTADLQERAKFNANLITISSLINTIGIAPFIFMALGNWGFLAPFVLGGINAASNGLGAIASKHSPGYRTTAWYGLGGFFCLNLLLTAFTGPGIVMITNGLAVQKQLAENIINDQYARLEAAKQPDETVEKLRADIEEKQRQLQQIVAKDGEAASRQNPEWQRLQLSLYGTYEERTTDWTTVKTPNLPLTHKLERVETEQLAAYQAQKAALNEKLSRRVNYGDDVQFLEAEMPSHFNSDFRVKKPGEYELKSVADALAIATELFIDDFKAGEFSQLAFPMLMAGISTILSLIACLLTYSFARSPVVQDSLDPEKRILVQKAIDILRQQFQQPENFNN